MEMTPIAVSSVAPLRRWWCRIAISTEPFVHGVVVELLGPKQSCVALTTDHVLLVGGILRDDLRVELVGFLDAGVGWLPDVLAD